MSRRHRHPAPALALLLAFVALVGGPARPASATPAGGDGATGQGCRIDGVPRVVAVADVHGAYDRFLGILRSAGIVDAKGSWAGGKAHLVQLGDVLDRGRETRRALDLLMRLEQQAPKAGGRVHALLGNHEVMNMVGDLRYVNPDEYQDYAGVDSQELRERFLKSVLNRARRAAGDRGEVFNEPAFRTQLLARTPLGFVERTQAFSADGRYGRWLRGHDAVVEINHVVFVHGGLTPETAALGCEGINAAVHRELTDDLARTRENPAATLSAGENGPMWYRGLARQDETAGAPALEKVLKAMDARALVVGHTVTHEGRIQQRFGGRVVMLDAGMTDEYGGHAAALEIDGDGRMTAIYPDSREPLGKAAAAGLTPATPRHDTSRRRTTSLATAHAGG